MYYDPYNKAQGGMKHLLKGIALFIILSITIIIFTIIGFIVGVLLFY